MKGCETKGTGLECFINTESMKQKRPVPCAVTTRDWPHTSDTCTHEIYKSSINR